MTAPPLSPAERAVVDRFEAAPDPYQLSGRDLQAVLDVAALLAHVQAALVAVDRLNARRAGTVAPGPRTWLVAIADLAEEQFDAAAQP